MKGYFKEKEVRCNNVKCCRERTVALPHDAHPRGQCFSVGRAEKASVECLRDEGRIDMKTAAEAIFSSSALMERRQRAIPGSGKSCHCSAPPLPSDRGHPHQLVI